tara:strand:- start:6911 stop:10762 length:3852 start_codon:yes stop_codon:yes gene_type:complete
MSTLDKTTDPLSVNGYYPLFKSAADANTVSSAGTSHSHQLNGETYYMPNGGVLDTDFYHGNHIPKSVKKVNVLHPGGGNQDIVLYDLELVGKGLGAYENSSKDYYKGKIGPAAVVYNAMVRGMGPGEYDPDDSRVVETGTVAEGLLDQNGTDARNIILPADTTFNFFPAYYTGPSLVNFWIRVEDEAANITGWDDTTKTVTTSTDITASKLVPGSKFYILANRNPGGFNFNMHTDIGHPMVRGNRWRPGWRDTNILNSNSAHWNKLFYNTHRFGYHSDTRWVSIGNDNQIYISPSASFSGSNSTTGDFKLAETYSAGGKEPQPMTNKIMLPFLKSDNPANQIQGIRLKNNSSLQSTAAAGAVAEGDITLSIWILSKEHADYWVHNQNYASAIALGNKANNQYMSIGVHKTIHNRMGFYNGYNDYQMSNNEHMTNNNWNHLVITWSGAGDKKLKCYFNGSETQQSINVNLTANLTLGTDTKYGIGSAAGTNNSQTFFRGFVSNACVFDKTLSAAEVNTLYNGGFPMSNPTTIGNLLHWWKLDNLTTGLQDQVGTNNLEVNSGALSDMVAGHTTDDVVTANTPTAAQLVGKTDVYVQAGPIVGYGTNKTSAIYRFKSIEIETVGRTDYLSLVFADPPAAGANSGIFIQSTGAELSSRVYNSYPTPTFKPSKYSDIHLQGASSKVSYFAPAGPPSDPDPAGFNHFYAVSVVKPGEMSNLISTVYSGYSSTPSGMLMLRFGSFTGDSLMVPFENITVSVFDANDTILTEGVSMANYDYQWTSDSDPGVIVVGGLTVNATDKVRFNFHPQGSNLPSIVKGGSNGTNDSSDPNVRNVDVTLLKAIIFSPNPSLVVRDALAGTGIDAAVATAANADVAAVAADADDTVVTTASTNALKRFSEDAQFGNTNFTKAKKRKVLKNLMKQIVNKLSTGKFQLNDKTEFLKFVKPTDDSIDLSSKLKDKIEVIKPGAENVTVNMDNASVYVPFGDGESQTFVDSVTGKEFTMGKTGSDFTLTVADSQGAAHAIPPNYTGVADQEGQVYTYVDVENNRETIFVWGSGTASSNNSTGQVQGDPYITTLAGVTYKMDDFTGYVRLLQGEYEGKTFTINAENKLLTKSEIKELLEWRQTKMQGMNFSDNVRFGKFPAYFSKFYVSHGDKYAIVDANSLQVLETNYEPQMAHSIQINKGYVWSEALKTVSRADLTVGELQVSMMSYEDKDIRNGFKLFNMDKLQNRSGALEHPIYVKDMKIRSIRSVVPIKQQSARKNKKVSKEEIIENGLKTQYTFKVF